MSSLNMPPPVTPETALFVDVDGTLLELARHPEHARAAPRPKVSLALNSRRAAAREEAAREAIGRARNAADGDFHFREGKIVFELEPSGRTRGTAVAERWPIFVDKDVPDEDGFTAVNGMGGDAVRVGPAENNAARFQATGAGQVVAWLDAAWEAEHGVGS